MLPSELLELRRAELIVARDWLIHVLKDVAQLETALAAEQRAQALDIDPSGAEYWDLLMREMPGTASECSRLVWALAKLWDAKQCVTRVEREICLLQLQQMELEAEP